MIKTQPTGPLGIRWIPEARIQRVQAYLHETLILNSAAGPSYFLAVAIWENWGFHFVTMGDNVGTSRAYWRTMGAAGWTQGAANFHDYGTIWGPYFESCLATEVQNSVFFELVSKTFIETIFQSKSERPGT